MYPWYRDTVVLPDQYEQLVAELGPSLSSGTVRVRGKSYTEPRLTGLFSPLAQTMKYSGRTAQAMLPPPTLAALLELINSQSFQEAVAEREPRLAGIIPQFNSIFVNHYRPLSEDHLGLHSDSLADHASEVILSLTFCQKQGARIFRFFAKGSTTTHTQMELQTGEMLWMLPGCQAQFSHAVNYRKTNLAGERITGGRLNLTFRCLKL